jgi:hypothetical protein
MEELDAIAKLVHPEGNCSFRVFFRMKDERN